VEVLSAPTDAGVGRPEDHGHGGTDAADASAALAEFRRFREQMNAEILGENNLVVNRFFALDGRTYEAGALGVKTKELLGLVASLVLRCDDCITYHAVRCREEGVTRAACAGSRSSRRRSGRPRASRRTRRASRPPRDSGPRGR
jgi:AhpD family alkylhydroperoxidase